jgi:protein tyrosine phosphatase (PTP) superfamily phosphohydrolase (DUF442 family)
MNRVRLANVLIEESQMGPAAREFDRAAAVLGPNGQAKVEALREKLPQIDERMLAFCKSSSAE